MPLKQQSISSKYHINMRTSWSGVTHIRVQQKHLILYTIPNMLYTFVTMYIFRKYLRIFLSPIRYSICFVSYWTEQQKSLVMICVALYRYVICIIIYYNTLRNYQYPKMLILFKPWLISFVVKIISLWYIIDQTETVFYVLLNQ